MADFPKLQITSSGRNALLEAQSGTKLTFSKIGLGSGTATSGIADLTALVIPKLMLTIMESKINSSGEYMTVTANMTNESLSEGFYWKEIGLFFKDASGNDVLFAYSCITDTKYDYIPAFSDQRYVKSIQIASIVTGLDGNITIEEAEGILYVDTVTFNIYKEEVRKNFEGIREDVKDVIKKNDIVDDLESEDEDLPLSARQGMLLNKKVSEIVEEMFKQILNKHYPVGRIIMTENDSNPGGWIGGTWEYWGSGRFPAGVNKSDANFNTAAKTGGASTVKLTAKQSGVPAHAHGLNGHTHNVGEALAYKVGTSTIGRKNIASGSSYKAFATTNVDDLIYGATSGGASGNTAKNTGVAAEEAHNNLPPYITCYFWKRVA